MTTLRLPVELSGVIEPTAIINLISAQADVRLIDVRSDAEFESQHIPGSFNIPLGTIDAHLHALVTIDTPLVLVCKSGARATQAHDQLASAGKAGIGVLKGGLDAWSHHGGEVAVGSKEQWAMDRQVRLVAGSLTLLGIGASIIKPQAKWLSGAIGAGLTFSAVSNTCAMANGLARLPYNRASNPVDTHAVVDELRRSTSTGA